MADLGADQLSAAEHVPDADVRGDLIARPRHRAGDQRLRADALPIVEVRHLIGADRPLEIGGRIEHREIAGEPHVGGDDLRHLARQGRIAAELRHRDRHRLERRAGRHRDLQLGRSRRRRDREPRRRAEQRQRQSGRGTEPATDALRVGGPRRGGELHRCRRHRRPRRRREGACRLVAIVPLEHHRSLGSKVACTWLHAENFSEGSL